MKIATSTTYICIMNSHKTHLIVKTSFDKNAIILLYKTECGRKIQNDKKGINTYMACGKKQLEKWELNKIIFLNSSIRLTEQTNRKKK